MVDLLIAQGWQWLVLVVLLGCSAFFNCSETALFSLTPNQLHALRRSGHRVDQLVADLMKDSDRLLLTILVGNNAVHVLLFADTFLLVRHLASHWGSWAISVFSVVSLLVVLVFAEVVPKVVAMAGSQRIAVWVAPGIRLCQVVLSPIRAVLDSVLVIPLTRLLERPVHVSARVTAEDLKTLLDLSRHGGVIDAGESLWLQQVVDLTQARVHEVMVPRVDVEAWDLTSPPADPASRFRELGLMKVPVYRGDIDHIVGLLYARDVLLHPVRPLREMIHPVRFVPEQMRLDQLLSHFRRTGTQLAIVVDEYGGVVGLVALEDVLEHIVGEIRDPGEIPPAEVVENEDGTFSVVGRLSVRVLAQVFGAAVLNERVDTIAGLFLARFGRIPTVGDETRLGNLWIRIEALDGRRIERVRVGLVDRGGE